MGTKKEAAYVQTYRDISEWSGLLGPQKATILLATVLLLFSGFVMAADFMMSEKVCFKAFAITDRIGDADELGGLDSNALNLVIAPAGWAALCLSAIALALHVAFGKWLAALARRRCRGSKERGAPAEATIIY